MFPGSKLLQISRSTNLIVYIFSISMLTRFLRHLGKTDFEKSLSGARGRKNILTCPGENRRRREAPCTRSKKRLRTLSKRRHTLNGVKKTWLWRWRRNERIKGVCPRYKRRVRLGRDCYAVVDAPREGCGIDYSSVYVLVCVLRLILTASGAS